MIKITIGLSSSTEEEIECFNTSRLIDVIRSGRAAEFNYDGYPRIEIVSINPVMDGTTGNFIIQ